MKFDITHFDPKKIGNMKPDFVLRTDSYRQIESIFKDVMEYSLMVVINGESGFGKSYAFSHLLNMPNTYLYTVEKSSTAKSVYTDLLGQFGVENSFGGASLNALIRSVCYNLNETPEKKVIVFDEAGKITAQKLLFLHEFRDSTKDKNNLGIILAGPSYFKKAFNKWQLLDIEGIKELGTRIQAWHKIKQPPLKDKRAFCEAHGIINNELISQLSRKHNNYRTLENDIMPFKIAYQRYLEENKKNKNKETETTK